MRRSRLLSISCYANHAHHCPLHSENGRQADRAISRLQLPRRCPGHAAIYASRPRAVLLLHARELERTLLASGHSARRSARFWSMLRAGYGPAASSARRLVSPAVGQPPPAARCRAARLLHGWCGESCGIEPGVMPPMSAWCPRAATKKRSADGSSRSNTGMMTVTSGRCVPPAYGAFSAYASPGSPSSGLRAASISSRRLRPSSRGGPACAERSRSGSPGRRTAHTKSPSAL